MESTGEKYFAAYQQAIEKAERGELPPLGIHVIIGESALTKTWNSARSIAERRTHPIQVICRKP